MSDERDDDVGQKKSDLVSQIYAGTLNPSMFNSVLKAWDQHFLAVMKDDDPREPDDFSWTDEFITHFEQAGEFFDRISGASERPLRDRIEDLPSAAIICRSDGRVVFFNSLAKPLFTSGTQDNLFDKAFERRSTEVLSELCRDCQKRSLPDDRQQRVVRLAFAEQADPSVFLASIIVDTLEPHEQQSPFILLRAVTTAWDREIGRSISGAFQLTNAELTLVENLYKGLSVREIAEWTNRSQATLRTQLSSVLQKTSTKSQADLLRVVTGLVQVLIQRDRLNRAKSTTFEFTAPELQRSYTLDLENDLKVEVVESGDLSGMPFFFIQTANMPTLTSRIVHALAQEGIRLVSPIRSGVGHTSKRPISLSAAEWGRFYADVMQATELEFKAIGGQCSGGVYAMEVAKLFPTRIDHVLLVDTGAPLKSAGMINLMPLAPRRLFLAARYFPSALRTPYKWVTTDFYSGTDGEKRLVDYFFDGSPSDQAVIDQGNYWEITRDNIDYCLRNPFQTMMDVSNWSKDGSATLRGVTQNANVRYFQGQDNLMHQARSVHALADELQNVSFNIVPERAQLLIYQEPSLFAREIRAACEG